MLVFLSSWNVGGLAFIGEIPFVVIQFSRHGVSKGVLEEET